MYILILGLDVLGNPFGFIRGLSEGVEAFFYEPYQVKFSAALFTSRWIDIVLKIYINTFSV